MLLVVQQMDTSRDSPESCMCCDTSPEYKGAGSSVGQKILGLAHILGLSR